MSFFLTPINRWRLRTAGYDLFWIILGHGVALLGAMTGVKVLTKYLPPQQYGEVMLGMTLASLIQQLLFSGPGGAILRFFSVAIEKGEFTDFFTAALKAISARTVIVCLFAVCLILSLLTLEYAQWVPLVVATFVFSAFSSYPIIFDSMQNAARQQGIVAWHQALNQWLRILFAVILISIIGAVSTAAMWGFALSSILVLVSQGMLFYFRIYRKAVTNRGSCNSVAKRWERQLADYSWPFTLWGLFYWLQIASDRWAIQMFMDTAQVGLYVVLYQLGYYPLNMLMSLFGKLVTPIVFTEAGDCANTERMVHAHTINIWLFGGYLCLTFAITAIAVIFHERIFRLLVAPEFGTISSLLPIMVLAGGLFGCGQAASIALTSEVQTKSLILPTIGSSLIGILCNILGAYLFGLRGVVWANTIFSSVYLTWILVTIRTCRIGSGLSFKYAFSHGTVKKSV